MGGDSAPQVVLDGLALFASERSDVAFQLHGKARDLETEIERIGLTDRCTIVHHDTVVSMSEKPAVALRRRVGTSMWGALEAVKTGSVQAAFSA